MGSYSPQIRLEELSAETPDARLQAARELLLEYGRFVIAQPGAARFCFGALEKEAEKLPSSYLEQQGGILLALSGENPVGVVAWRELPAAVSPHAWELKRLWVRPSGRGLGIGRMLTEAVLDRAHKRDRLALYLDTAPAAMPAAYRLYLDMGFQACSPYNDNPVEGLAYLVKYL